MRLCPAVGLSLPSSQLPPESSGAALLARKGVKSFFWLLLGDCASSFLDGTDPSRKGEPQKLADRYADGLKQSPAPCQSADQLPLKRRPQGLRFFA
jgi:hypothetical protein